MTPLSSTSLYIQHTEDSEVILHAFIYRTVWWRSLFMISRQNKSRSACIPEGHLNDTVYEGLKWTLSWSSSAWCHCWACIMHSITPTWKFRCQVEQANRMVTMTQINLQASKTVSVPIPTVEHGREDARSILGVNVNDTNQCKTAVPCSILEVNVYYSRHQLDLYRPTQQLMNMGDICRDKVVIRR